MNKTWREKLADDKGLPKVCDVRAGRGIRSGEGRMVIAAPREVDALMRQMRRGRFTTIPEIRSALARRHGADFACPLTTGIFSWIAAHAAAAELAAGRKRATPYWRALKAGGELNPKYPGGLPELSRRLRAEGHRIVQKDRKYLVADHHAKLFTRLK